MEEKKKRWDEEMLNILNHPSRRIHLFGISSFSTPIVSVPLYTFPGDRRVRGVKADMALMKGKG